MDSNDMADDVRRRYAVTNGRRRGDTRNPSRNTVSDIGARVFIFVGIMHAEREKDELAFRRTISKLWLPKEGVNIKKLSQSNRYLFKFFHINDYNHVWSGNPWNFNNNVLVLALIKHNEDPLKIDVHTVSTKFR